MFQALLSVAGGSGWALPFCGATGAASMWSPLWHWHFSNVSEGCSVWAVFLETYQKAQPCLPI